MHEVPFMLTNVPEIQEVVDKWSSDEYLTRSFGKTPQHVLKSSSNHFMYWSKQQARQQRESCVDSTASLPLPHLFWLLWKRLFMLRSLLFVLPLLLFVLRSLLLCCSWLLLVLLLASVVLLLASAYAASEFKRKPSCALQSALLHVRRK
jgi:hypothetical protein